MRSGEKVQLMGKCWGRAMTRLVMCEDCRKQFAVGDLLRAPHPFDPTEDVYGCPDCRGLELRWLVTDPEPAVHHWALDAHGNAYCPACVA